MFQLIKENMSNISKEAFLQSFSFNCMDFTISNFYGNAFSVKNICRTNEMNLYGCDIFDSNLALYISYRAHSSNRFMISLLLMFFMSNLFHRWKFLVHVGSYFFPVLRNLSSSLLSTKLPTTMGWLVAFSVITYNISLKKQHYWNSDNTHLLEIYANHLFTSPT